MTLLITLVAVSLIVYFGSGLIKKYPVVFYLLAVALGVAYILFRFFIVYNPFAIAALQVIQKGLIAYVLFAIVMFIGVLAETSKLKERLYPIRAELSLLGCLFALGHIAGYLTSYLTTFIRDSGAIPTPVFISILVSLSSFVLLLVLGITTFAFVRSRMNPIAWKRVQRISYVFFALIYLHMLLMLVPTIKNGALETILAVIIYTVIFVAYVVLRIRKAAKDRKVIQ